MKNWKEAVVSPTATLQYAIEAMDREALRIVLIVDDEGVLVGTLTDGDVRRAVLRRLPLETPVSEVMHRNPSVATSDWSDMRMLSWMEKHQLLQLPVVNAEGQLIGLRTLHDLLERPAQDNPVFLMAGGFGTRLRPLTNNCPKPMLKVGEKPILELILESFKSYGFHRFYISTHYMPEMIRDYFGDGKGHGVEITYVHEAEPLGTGGALGLLPHDEVDRPLFLMNGDLLTTTNFLALLSHHEELDGAATMCVREYEHQIPYGVIEADGHHITGMVEKPVHRFNINAGIYVLSPELVRSVKRGTRVDMPTLLEREIKSGRKVSQFPVNEYWLDIGRLEDFQRAQRDFISLGGI
ncbi:nucleotidyltransferase family protein [Achromobacter animicus]|uniref:nucleotidyltransferase family protein n=1 Tax=Achromobacter animicus TaxID=1389935 RepID=UPI0028AEF93B|nr:nucleotidyltransferase family protein [Achromobacter animicus]